MNKILQTPPDIEPITLAELKEHARIDSDDENDLLSALIRAAREYCENYTRIAFITQDWLCSLDAKEFSDPFKGEIDLKQGKIQEVESITTYDESDNPTVFDEDNYRISYQRIVLATRASWPYELRRFDAMEILYTVGYGDTTEDVPQPIKQAIKMLAAYWFEAREAAGDMMGSGKEDQIPFGIQSLLIPYKRFCV